MPIPVIVDGDAPSDASDVKLSASKPALGNVTNTSTHRPPPLNLPTVTVTKPPAPRPVELPTPRDINHGMSPPDSVRSSFDEDLESGRSIGSMRHVLRGSEDGLVATKRSPLAKQVSEDHDDSFDSEDAIAVPLPPSPPRGSTPLASPRTVVIPVPATSTPANIPDLLTDAAPAMDTVTIEPTSPLRSEPTQLEQPPPPADVPRVDGMADSAEPDPADVTVRLVGGGGSSGVATPVPESVIAPGRTASPDAVDTASVHSTDSKASAVGKEGKDAKKHKKTKSGLASLKKQLTSLRKKDSSSSVKDMIPPTTTK